MRRIARSLLVLSLVTALVLVVPGTPLSACCDDDDFWCWAGAVATGGVSCAIENFINSVKTLMSDVRALQDTVKNGIQEIRNASVGGVKDASDEAGRLANAAFARYEEARKNAARINDLEHQTQAKVAKSVAQGLAKIGPASSSALLQPTPTPAKAGGAAALGAAAASVGSAGHGGGSAALVPQKADEAALKQAIARAADVVEKQKAAQSGRQAAAATQAQKAVESATIAAEAAADTAGALLLLPLNDLLGVLGDLIAHPDHVLDPVAVVDAQVADQMTKLHQSRSKADLDALNRLLPPPSVDLSRHLVAAGIATHLGSSVAFGPSLQAKARGGVSKSGEIAGRLSSRLNTTFARVQRERQLVLKPTPVPGADARLAQKLDAMFVGLSKAQADAKKDALLAEAKRRFARDPKTLAGVEALLTRETTKRTAALANVPRPLVTR